MSSDSVNGRDSREVLLGAIAEWQHVLSAYFYHRILEGGPPGPESPRMFRRFQKLTTFLCHLADTRKARLDPSPIERFYTLVCRCLAKTEQPSVAEADVAILAAEIVLERLRLSIRPGETTRLDRDIKKARESGQVVAIRLDLPPRTSSWSGAHDPVPKGPTPAGKAAAVRKRPVECVWKAS